MIVAPQSFGSLLNPHAHLHAVSSLGVFDQEGTFDAAPDDLDFTPLEALFRERTLKMMLKLETITAERGTSTQGARTRRSKRSRSSSARNGERECAQREQGVPQPTEARGVFGQPHWAASFTRDWDVITSSSHRSSFSPCSCLTSLCATRSGYAPTARSRPRSGSNIPERVRVDPGTRGELDAGRDYRR
jgi:hypothetical protein